MPTPPPPDDDDTITLRVPRRASFALLAAVVVHVCALYFSEHLPMPQPVPKRIELTLTSTPPGPASPPPPPPSMPAAAPNEPKRVARKTAPPPPQAPVVPELAPTPREDVAKLPVAEKTPDALPPPEPAPPATWQDRLSQQLAMTRPVAPKLPTGALAPSLANLDRVIMSDASLHDDFNERRLMEDHGQFFRRGLEALRSNWHPDTVLREGERSRDPTRKCGRSERTTFAIAVLDRKGRVVDVDVKRESGCPQLDQEAVSAFLRVANFPNPPDGIFTAPDGTPTDTARYPVRFIVTFNGGLRIDWGG